MPSVRRTTPGPSGTLWSEGITNRRFAPSHLAAHCHQRTDLTTFFPVCPERVRVRLLVRLRERAHRCGASCDPTAYACRVRGSASRNSVRCWRWTATSPRIAQPSALGLPSCWVVCRRQLPRMGAGQRPKPAVAIGGIDVSAQNISFETWDRFTRDCTWDLANGFRRIGVGASMKQL